MSQLGQLGQEVRDAVRLPPPQMRRAIRLAAGVSQVRLGAELDVHRVTILRWESGKREPGGALRVAYARLLRELEEAVR